MAVYKRGKVWWYRFVWNAEEIRQSSKQGSKRVAEQMEAAHKTSLAKGEVGIRTKAAAPPLAKFMDNDFLPFVESTKAGKPNTVRFYRNSVTNLKGYPKLAGLPLDQITAEHIAGFIAYRQSAKVQVSTLNRDLATLRRVFHLAQEWGKVSTVLPRVRLLAGENHRERVLSGEEERAYLEAAADLGNAIAAAYQKALEGIRAVQRGEQPRRSDAFLLRDVATLLLDCGIRPEECFRLKWADNIRDGAVEIHTGKGRGSRRRIPASARVVAVLEMRRQEALSEWVFPAETKSGHIEASSLKKQHAAAVKASKVPAFVLYTLRHTCITRWAKHMDPFTLHKLAGHTDMNTTKRYVHPSDEDVLEAMERVRSGHKFGHRPENSAVAKETDSAAIN
jgi:integrase